MMMTPKRAAYRLFIRSLERLTRWQPCSITIHLPQKGEKIQLCLVVIAFNNAELIAYQTAFLRKFISDPFLHVVADNSTDAATSIQLQAFCEKEGITYLRLPKNHLNRVGSSYSHANAVNYVYHHFLRKIRPVAFGILDHDLFPTSAISPLAYLKTQPFYGPLRQRKECWYLSAIMSFYDFQYVEQKGGLDYMPVTPFTTYLDTGGGNYYRLYKGHTPSKFIFPTEEIEVWREGADRHGDSLEYFDQKRWLHTINGSCWKQVAEGKDEHVKQLLDNILC